jgi:hypothetical protein
MSQGLSLLDIAPASENVLISTDTSLAVYGISVRDIIALLQRFPEAQQWISGGKLDTAHFIQTAPNAIAAVIAAGCKKFGNEEAEARAAELTIETQLDILEAVSRLTFRSGFGPFVQRITGAANLAAALSGNSGKAPDTNSPQVSTPLPQTGADPDKSGN